MYTHYFNNTVKKLMENVSDDIMPASDRSAITMAYNRNQFGYVENILRPYAIDKTPVTTKQQAAVKTVCEQLYTERQARRSSACIACMELIALCESDAVFTERINRGIIAELNWEKTERAYKITKELYDSVAAGTDAYTITKNSQLYSKITRILSDILELLWPLIDMNDPAQDNLKPRLRYTRNTDTKFDRHAIILSRAATVAEVTRATCRMEKHILLRVFEHRPDHGGASRFVGEIMFNSGECLTKPDKAAALTPVRNRFVHNVTAIHAYDKSTILVYIDPEFDNNKEEPAT